MCAFDSLFSYDDHDPRVWCDILNFEVDRKVYEIVYNIMCYECDLIWKIMHDAIPTVLIEDTHINTMITCEFAKLTEWLNANELSINVSKSHYMVFHRSRRKINK